MIRPAAPVLLTALVLSAGITQGLYRPVGPSLSALLLTGLLLTALAMSCLPRENRGPRARTSSVLFLAITLACGSILGSNAGRGIRHGCEASLASGTPLEVQGALTEEVSATRGSHPPGGYRRISLERVLVSADRGRCELRRLTAFLDRDPGSLRSGENLRLSGEWLRLRTTDPLGQSLDLPGRTGILVGAEVMNASRRRASAAGAAGAASGRLPLYARLRGTLRAGAARRLRDRLPGSVDPTARALLLAERNDLSPILRGDFVNAGLAHLLAISGLHVGIVSGLLFALVSAVVRGRARYPAVATAVGCYVILLGAPVPAFRAFLLFTGWAIARWRGRPLRGADLLGGAAIVFLVSDPVSLATPGLQLSFAGFAGVSLGLASARGLGTAAKAPTRGLQRLVIRSGSNLCRALAASAGAFLATAPIAAWHFGRVAPISIVASLAGTPVVALSIWSLAGTLLPGPLGNPFAAAAALLLSLLHHLAGWFGGRPGAHLEVAPPSAALWLAWGLAFLALSRPARGARWTRVFVPMAAAISVLVAGPGLERLGERHDHGQLCTLSVGQGDAAIFRTPGGRWIVLDGGPSARPGAGRDAVAAALRRRGARRVALLALSHPDLDHIGGLEAVVAEFPVGAVLDSGDPLPRAGYRRLLAATSEKQIPWLRARNGVRIRVDEIEILVLGPDSSTSDAGSAKRTSSNETSLMLRITAGDFRYVTTGDATAEEEIQVLSRWPAESLRADVLKVGHHGSRTSSSAAWLDAVRPTVAIISAGAGNRFGHPHPEVVQRIRRAGIPEVWRTDRRGTLCIDIRSDGSWRMAGRNAWKRAAAAGPESRHED
ncbi:MAG: ComEC/Rec2 family competence protein [marine benthic group bacterium]|nr:ComEC/Rec2 family competence protein [Candidatus Carthagonibacter metallireducens]